MTSAAQAPIPLDQSDIHYLSRFYSKEAIEGKVREGRFVIVEQKSSGQQYGNNSNKK